MPVVALVSCNLWQASYGVYRRRGHGCGRRRIEVRRHVLRLLQRTFWAVCLFFAGKSLELRSWTSIQTGTAGLYYWYFWEPIRRAWSSRM
jgi:hypothetical protein